MARKRKGELPSGNIRVRIYDYTDLDGKRHYQSFTGRTKAEAEAMANEWKANRRERSERRSLYECVGSYIDMKSGLLSPTTIKGYRSMFRNLKSYGIAAVPVRDIDNQKLQAFVAEMSASHSTKYVKNFFGLISATLGFYMPSFAPRVRFAQAEHVETYTPTDEDVQTLLDHCKTTEAKLGILFGAVGFMRRGEACAVTFDDLDFRRRTIRVTKAMVYDEDNILSVKEPKTFESYRTVAMPEYVFDLIRSLGRNTGTVLGMDPNQLYKAFAYALRKSGLPHFRYHDLRHHAASYAHSIGIGDRYIERMGGWRPNSPVLKKTYENVIDLELAKSQKAFLEKQQFSV